MKRSYERNRTAFLKLCDDAGTTFSHQCREALLNGDLASLERVRESFAVGSYHSVKDFAVDYLVHSYISKLDDPKNVKQLDEECLAGFLETEKRNREWNRKLRTTLPSGAEALINSVRRKIRAVLGDPDRNLFSFANLCDWGPGATFSLGSVESTLNKKILEPRLSITPRAVPYFLAYVETAQCWFNARHGVPVVEGPCTWLPSEFDVVRGERFSTAPKKWNKRRTISIQPTANLFLQKGFGSFVRRRLKRFGIDLDDQSRNQRLARSAYVNGDATLDLKEASNSMLVEHIRLYFDEDWVNLMEDLRSPEIRLPDGSWHRLELHSAMGNGYTFEVESLLFWAIAQSVVDLYAPGREASVYGDDIIVPQSCAQQTIEVLEANGFRVNREKTFTEGNFFESCGKHYFQGCDVTPIFEKKIASDLNDCIRSFNRLNRWCRRMGTSDQFRRTLNYLELRAYSALHSWWERFGDSATRNRRRPGVGYMRKRRQEPRFPLMPYQAEWVEGDGGLITDDPSLLPNPDQNGIYVFKLLVARPVQLETDGWSVLSNTLMRAESGGCGGSNPPSDLLATKGRVTPRDTVQWKLAPCRMYRWQREDEVSYCL